MATVSIKLNVDDSDLRQKISKAEKFKIKAELDNQSLQQIRQEKFKLAAELSGKPGTFQPGGLVGVIPAGIGGVTSGSVAASLAVGAGVSGLVISAPKLITAPESIKLPASKIPLGSLLASLHSLGLTFDDFLRRSSGEAAKSIGEAVKRMFGSHFDSKKLIDKLKAMTNIKEFEKEFDSALGKVPYTSYTELRKIKLYKDLKELIGKKIKSSIEKSINIQKLDSVLKEEPKVSGSLIEIFSKVTKDKNVFDKIKDRMNSIFQKIKLTIIRSLGIIEKDISSSDPYIRKISFGTYLRGIIDRDIRKIFKLYNKFFEDLNKSLGFDIQKTLITANKLLQIELSPNMMRFMRIAISTPRFISRLGVSISSFINKLGDLLTSFIIKFISEFFSKIVGIFSIFFSKLGLGSIIATITASIYRYVSAIKQNFEMLKANIEPIIAFAGNLPSEYINKSAFRSVMTDLSNIAESYGVDLNELLMAMSGALPSIDKSKESIMRTARTYAALRYLEQITPDEFRELAAFSKATNVPIEIMGQAYNMLTDSVGQSARQIFTEFRRLYEYFGPNQLPEMFAMIEALSYYYYSPQEIVQKLEQGMKSINDFWSGQSDQIDEMGSFLMELSQSEFFRNILAKYETFPQTLFQSYNELMSLPEFQFQKLTESIKTRIKGEMISGALSESTGLKEFYNKVNALSTSLLPGFEWAVKPLLISPETGLPTIFGVSMMKLDQVFNSVTEKLNEMAESLKRLTTVDFWLGIARDMWYIIRYTLAEPNLGDSARNYYKWRGGIYY